MGDNLFAGSAAVASVQEKTAAKPAAEPAPRKSWWKMW